MKYGIVLPKGDARTAADFAAEAERCGWDGFFVWEPVWGIDAWVCLTAAAMRTEKIRLGTMITPISRMRPWKLASETATLDNLSNGRVILSIGLGATDTGFSAFGEVTDRKTRAELVDEGLEILTGLWHGQPFEFHGKHYHVHETSFSVPPPPLQKPRIPIWVVGAWPRERSMQRVLRYDGLLPSVMEADGKVRMDQPTPSEVGLMRDYISTRRTATTPFDIVVEGETGTKSREVVSVTMHEWADAGVTWWIEATWSAPDIDAVLERIRRGPPQTT